jgi:hypothetical protein
MRSVAFRKCPKSLAALVRSRLSGASQDDRLEGLRFKLGRWIGSCKLAGIVPKKTLSGYDLEHQTVSWAVQACVCFAV